MKSPVETTFRIAANYHAKANPSDPFAYARMLTHLRMGIETPAEVISDARPRLSRQQTTGIAL